MNNLNKSTKDESVQFANPNTQMAAKIFVIGGGPVGIRFAQEILSRNNAANITVFGNEPYQPYNRVQLSSLLAGDITYDDIITELPETSAHPNFKYEVRTIHNINTDTQTLTDNQGHIFQYDTLVVATGSRPHVPNIQGVDQTGVYTFRNLKDTEFLYTRRARSRHTVVLGGGLLGLEAARALATFNTRVTLVQQGMRLMNRQLDDEAAALLKRDVEKLGISVVTQQGVREIHGQENRVTGVTLRGGERIDCDTVLVCAGIKPNIEIARNAGIKVAKGILVDDHLKTSAQNVYAIGECSEHKGLTYGLVNPGFEQAAIAADHIYDGHSRYTGSLEVSRLKVVGSDVYSMGDVNDIQKHAYFRELRYKNKKDNTYRKLCLHKNKVIGAVAYGEWTESRRVQEAYQNNRTVWPWQQLSFKYTGYVWGKNSANSPQQWPASAIICQCNNITQGTLTQAIKDGVSSLSKLSDKTTAGTVCGSCKPLLSELLGSQSKLEKEAGWLPILVACLLAVVFTSSIYLVPGMQVSDSVQTQSSYESIWNNKFWKQVTGFSLLGLSILGLFMSLRKRFKFTFLGKFIYWRYIHIFLGLSCVAILALHTGLHLGANLNQLLMLNFLAVLSIGAIAGGVISLSHTLQPKTASAIKTFFTWSHILVTWPLPVLLGIHILTVYYF